MAGSWLALGREKLSHFSNVDFQHHPSSPDQERQVEAIACLVALSSPEILSQFQTDFG